SRIEARDFKPGAEKGLCRKFLDRKTNGFRSTSEASVADGPAAHAAIMKLQSKAAIITDLIARHPRSAGAERSIIIRTEMVDRKCNIELPWSSPTRTGLYNRHLTR